MLSGRTLSSLTVLMLALAFWSLLFWLASDAAVSTAPAAVAPAAPAPVAPAAAMPRARAETAPAAEPAADPATAAFVELPGSDIVTERYPLSRGDVERLEPGGRLLLPDPEGGWITLDVDSVRSAGDQRTLRLRSGDLISTLTHGSQGFFGTIATPRGVYGIASSGTDSLLIDQQVLERRANPHRVDYALPPTHR